MNKARNLYLDLLKGLLITLVVLGHFIQYIGYAGESDCFQNKLFKLIYLFHMPLFLGISGYFTFFSVKKYSASVFLKKRIRSLFLPLLVWCIIDTLISPLIKGEWDTCVVLDLLYGNFLYSYWFIWAILSYSVVMAIAFRYKLDTWFPLLLVCLLLMSLPIKDSLFDLVESMLPFFVVGYLFAKIDITSIISWCRRYILLFVIASVFCYWMWQPGWFVYHTPSSWTNIDITLIRFFTGVVVSTTVMFVVFHIYKFIGDNKLFTLCAKLGQDSLAIYLSQWAVFIGIIEHFKYIRLTSNYHTVILVFPALLLVLLLYYFVIITSKNRTVAKLLYGK